MANKTAILIGLMLIGAVFIVLMGTAVATNPLDPEDWKFDPDGDGLTNVEEFDAGSDPNNADTDNDGLPDGWEHEYGLDPTDPDDALADDDYAGGEEYADFTQVPPPNYTNYDEYYRDAGTYDDGSPRYQHTDPQKANTDGDQYLDPDDPFPLNYKNDGVDGTPTDPTVGEGDVPMPKDSDGDGIPDETEMMMGTDPNNPDTDGDGLPDDKELEWATDPNDWDTDNDLLMDSNEMGVARESTDGHFVDSDYDGVDGDGGEDGPGPGPGPTPDPTPDPNPDPEPGPVPSPDPEDWDGDGIKNWVEGQIATDPNNPDTDGDGLMDGWEWIMGLDPNDWDSDDDLLMDGNELGLETDSTDGHYTDSDFDGI